MIQRKQTIWLLLASIIMLLTFFIPYGIHTETKLDTTVITETDLVAKGNYILMALSIAFTAFSFFLIFLYGNRKLQMNLCLLALLLAFGVLGFQLYHASQTSINNKLVVGILGSKIYLGVVIPILSAFFIIMAYIGIKGDEKLIRSADRLR